jgi:hypothetical protein
MNASGYATPRTGTSSVLERVNALRELIETHADANEAATQLSDEVVDALE